MDGQNYIYLGVTIDSKLKYSEHAKQVKKKIAHAWHLLYPLLNYKSKLSMKNKVTLIKSMLIPIASYAGELWMQANEPTKLKLQSYINRIICNALNTPRYMTNRKLREETGIETLATIQRRTLNTLDAMERHNEVIQSKHSKQKQNHQKNRNPQN